MSMGLAVPSLGTTGPDEDMEISSDVERQTGPTLDPDIDIDLEGPYDIENHDQDYVLEDVRSDVNAPSPLIVDDVQDDIMQEEENAHAMEDADARTVELLDLEDLEGSANDYEATGAGRADTEATTGTVPPQSEIHEAQESYSSSLSSHTIPVDEGSASHVGQGSDGTAAVAHEEAATGEPSAASTELHLPEDETKAPAGSEEPPVHVASPSARLHPVIVYYDDTEISLFPPSVGDTSETFFLQDETLAHAGMDELFTAMRSVLAGTIREDEELELGIDAIGLSLNENSVPTRSMTLSQIVDLYIRLYRQDGVEAPDPLYMTLTTKAGILSRLKELSAAADEGKGISQVYSWDNEDGQVPDDDKPPADEETAEHQGEDEANSTFDGESEEYAQHADAEEPRLEGSETGGQDDPTQAESEPVEHADDVASLGRSPAKEAAASPNITPPAEQNYPIQSVLAEGDVEHSSNHAEEAVDPGEVDDGDLIDYEEGESVAGVEDHARDSPDAVAEVDTPLDGTADDFIMQCYQPDICFCAACDDLPATETIVTHKSTSWQAPIELLAGFEASDEAPHVEDEVDAPEGDDAVDEEYTNEDEDYPEEPTWDEDASGEPGELEESEYAQVQAVPVSTSSAIADHGDVDAVSEPPLPRQVEDDDVIDYEDDEDEQWHEGAGQPEPEDQQRHEGTGQPDPEDEQWHEGAGPREPEDQQDEHRIEEDEGADVPVSENQDELGELDDGLGVEEPEIDDTDPPHAEEDDVSYVVHDPEQDEANGDYSGETDPDYVLDTAAAAPADEASTEPAIYGQDEGFEAESEQGSAIDDGLEPSDVVKDLSSPNSLASTKRRRAENDERVVHDAASQEVKRVRSR